MSTCLAASKDAPYLLELWGYGSRVVQNWDSGSERHQCTTDNSDTFAADMSDRHISQSRPPAFQSRTPRRQFQMSRVTSTLKVTVSARPAEPGGIREKC